jgi:hypothetical protein
MKIGKFRSIDFITIGLIITTMAGCVTKIEAEKDFKIAIDNYLG